MSHVYCCVDVEASGPVPGLHDLVSLGAVAVRQQEGGLHRVVPAKYYVELLPQGGIQDAHAMSIHGLTDAHLRAHGVGVDEALAGLDAWAGEQRAGTSERLVFVGHNAPFDWAYVNHAYHSVGRPNPFGWKALDTKALAMGVLALDWFDTNKEHLATLLQDLGDQEQDLVHRADYDALYQARVLCGLLDHPDRRRRLLSGGSPAGSPPDQA